MTRSGKIPSQVRLYMLAGGAGLLFLWWLSQRTPKTTGSDVPNSLAFTIGQNAANTAASIPVDFATGAVIGAGETIGVPATSISQCRAAMDAFDQMNWWDKLFQSFTISAQCPASDYLHWVGNHGYRP